MAVPSEESARDTMNISMEDVQPRDSGSGGVATWPRIGDEATMNPYR